MGKKNRSLREQPVPAAVSSEAISSRGKKVIAIGVGILAAGFILITYTDPMGRNWASVLAPFLIVGGYIAVGIGIFLPDSSPTSQSS